MKLFKCIVIILIIYNQHSYAQIKNSWASQEGIPINKETFNKLVGNSIIGMKNNKKFSVMEIIRIVRIENTITMNDLDSQNATFEDFRSLFISNYSTYMIKILHAKINKGMSYYSKQYDIYWGGVPHHNSMYKILN